MKMAGAFQRQTDFLKRKGISPVQGGWIVETTKQGGGRNARSSITPRFFKFF